MDSSELTARAGARLFHMPDGGGRIARSRVVLAVWCLLLVPVAGASAQEIVQPSRHDGQRQQAPQVDTVDWELTEPLDAFSAHGHSHGPRRGTLLQWSYGTSFSGGPDLSEPLVTDRPDFTEASSTVGRGVAQVEFGYTYVFNDDGDETLKAHSLGEPLLRYGILADWLEFRIALFPVNESTTSGGVSEVDRGTEDLYLGFKIGLTPQEGVLPEMALIPQMNVPTGSPAFTADEVQPGVNWLYSWELSDTVSVGGSTQGNRVLDDGTGDAYLEIAQSIAGGVALTEKLGVYSEWFAFFPSGADTAQVQHFYNGGFTYLVNDDVQFDVRAGVGLNSAADDFFAGTGLSVRFP